MKAFFVHLGLFVGGAALVGIGILCPPALPLVGPVASKLIVAAGGSIALAAFDRKALFGGPTPTPPAT